MRGFLREWWPLIAGGLVGVAFMAGVVAMMRTSKPGRPLAEVTPRPPEVVEAPKEATLTGKIGATKIVNIAAPIEGVVERFLADVGEQVFEGQLLATIRNPKVTTRAETLQEEAVKERAHVSELEAGLIDARLEASRSRADATRTKAELELSEKVYERQKMLFREGATARLTWEKAEADYNRLKTQSENFERTATAAEARIASITQELESSRISAQQKIEAMDSAKADLGMGEVHSPVDGLVLSRHGKAGAAVSLETADLFVIGANLQQLEVVTKAEPSVLRRLQAGAPAQIRLDTFPRMIEGTIREIKEGEVFIDFKSPDAEIKPGLEARVTLKLD